MAMIYVLEKKVQKLKKRPSNIESKVGTSNNLNIMGLTNNDFGIQT